MTLTRQTRHKNEMSMGEIYHIDGTLITEKPKWYARMFFRGMLKEDGMNFIWVPIDRTQDDLRWLDVHA